jgi:hypothetical protein
MYEYMSTSGAPVEPFIIQPMTNPDDVEEILVRPEHIGWWEDNLAEENEDGTWTDHTTLEDISPKIINDWLYGENGDNDGLIALEVDDETREPLLYEDTNKVMIKQADFVDEDDEPEYDSAGFIEDDRLEDEENFDDMDDLTDYDNPEWPHDHPKDKTDNDPD